MAYVIPAPDIALCTQDLHCLWAIKTCKVLVNSEFWNKILTLNICIPAASGTVSVALCSWKGALKNVSCQWEQVCGNIVINIVKEKCKIVEWYSFNPMLLILQQSWETRVSTHTSDFSTHFCVKRMLGGCLWIMIYKNKII